MLQLLETPPSRNLREPSLVELGVEQGTAGLLGRLLGTLDAIGLADNKLVLQAIRLGLQLHQGDERTYERYTCHLLRVTLRLIEDLGVTDPEIIAAAMLHDSLEDHPDKLAAMLGKELPTGKRKLRRMGRLALAECMNDTVAGYVYEVSNTFPRPGEKKVKAYQRHINKLTRRGSLGAVAIKLADFIDNTSPPAGVENPEKRRKLDKKQIKLYPAFMRAISRRLRGTISDPDAVYHQLEIGEQRALERIAQEPLYEAA